MSDHSSVVVASIPDCDLCKQAGKTEPAYADASLDLGVVQTWGYVCIQHFNLYGKGLGLGRGQRLLLADAPEKRTLSEPVTEDDDEDGDPEVDTVFLSKEHEAAANYVTTLIRKRDQAHAKIPLTDAERTSWNKRIAKAAVTMHLSALKAKR